MVLQARNRLHSLISCNWICNHHFGFHPGHSTLDMLLLLPQKWSKAINLKQVVRTVSLDISQVFKMHSGIQLCFASSLPVPDKAAFIAGTLISSSRAVNMLLSMESSALLSQWRWIMLQDSLKLSLVPNLHKRASQNYLGIPLFLFADDFTLCYTYSIPQAGSSCATVCWSRFDLPLV